MVALGSGEPVKNVPMGVNRPDGSRVWLTVNALPLRRSPGVPPYMVVASFFDVTEFKLALETSRQSEADRTRLLRETQEAVRVRDEFLTVASHELRTPLTSLRLHLQMLVRQLEHANTELAAQLAPRCESMERQIRRLTGLVTALLDVSRLAVGRLTLEPREVDLAQLVWQVADAFAGEFQRAGALLHVRGAYQPLVGMWDALRLEQVLVNLLSNAVRYGLGNPVEVAIRREGDWALLMVKDRGIGISEADLARIFGKFERAVSERNYGGLGLGLYITRQIVEAMGGSIEVRSKPGEGSVFLVRLPLNSPAAP
jgi:signal transduction histidine kinase